MKQTVTERNDTFLTAREAAEMLPGVSYQAILRWAKLGKVPFIELPSGRKYFRKSDIDALLRPAGTPGETQGAARRDS